MPTAVTPNIGQSHPHGFVDLRGHSLIAGRVASWTEESSDVTDPYREVADLCSSDMVHRGVGEVILSVSNLTVGFPSPLTVVQVPRDASFELRIGEKLGLIGESGCGKSVTCRSIIGLVPPPGEVIGGSIVFDGTDLTSCSRRDLHDIRGRDVSMVSQDPMTSLDPLITVGDQISEVLRSKMGLSRRLAQQRSIELLDRVGIPGAAERFRGYPHEMSGGMQQRVVIALAIACHPKLLLADEPTTGLDATIQDQILTLLEELCHQDGMAMILVSHDLGVVAERCDSICVMYAGSIVEQGGAKQILGSPSHPYTRALVSSTLPLDPSSRGKEVPTISGDVPDLANLSVGCPFQPRCPIVRPECRSVSMEMINLSSDRLTACPFSD